MASRAAKRSTRHTTARRWLPTHLAPSWRTTTIKPASATWTNSTDAIASRPIIHKEHTPTLSPSTPAATQPFRSMYYITRTHSSFQLFSSFVLYKLTLVFCDNCLDRLSLLRFVHECSCQRLSDRSHQGILTTSHQFQTNLNKMNRLIFNESITIAALTRFQIKTLLLFLFQ